MAAGSSFQIAADGGLIEVHEDGTTTRIQPLVAGSREPEEEAPVAPKRAAPTTSKKRSTRDIVRELKARLRQVNAEIRSRKSLEKERDQLTRLIAAAHGKTIAPVRELKRSAS